MTAPLPASPLLTPERLARDGASWRGTTIAREAWRLAAEAPDRIVYYQEHGPDLGYGEFALQARRLATSLRALGLLPGDTVSVQLPNWAEAAVIDVACAALGLVVNPIVPIYRDRELRFILQDARSRAIFLPARFRSTDHAAIALALQAELPALAHVVTVRAPAPVPGTLCWDALLQAGPADLGSLPVVSADAVKCRLYTSGTTGFPKAVLHTHNTLRRTNENSVAHGGIGPGDVMLMPSPVTHVTGYSSGINLPFVAGSATAFMDRWDATAAVALIERTGATHSVGATPFLQELLDAAERLGARLPTLRQYSCGGASVPPQLVRRARALLPHCATARVFGSTEIPVAALGWREQAELAATTDGRPWNYEIRILDDAGRELPAGVDGEIAARGAGMFLAYADPEQDREAHTADGFFLTGDIGYLTPEGALRVTDRKKDIIIRGGENLGAREIEDVLHAHPAVREAAVVAMPHPRLGEGVCALVIPREGRAPTLAELAAHCEAAGMARQKIPERLELVDALPRTPSGKVRKDLLRQRLREETEAASCQSPLPAKEAAPCATPSP